jgi:hypothetical protein
MLCAKPSLPRRFTVAPRPSGAPERRIITVSDAQGYSARSDESQRDLQNLMHEIEWQAARNAHLDPRRAITQSRGDGALIVWPHGISDVDLMTEFPRELDNELTRVNHGLSNDNEIRLRLAITSGIVEQAARGVTGQAAIRAAVLLDSDLLREALRRAAPHPLVVAVDSSMFDVVKTRRRNLRPEMYKELVVRDKSGQPHAMWITIPGATQQAIATAFGDLSGDGTGGGTDPPADGVTGSARKRGWTLSITVAVMSAVGAIAAVAALIAAFASGNPNDPQDLGSTSSPPTTSVSANATTSSDKLYPEVTDNHLGTDVFLDPMGDAVTSGPESIPYGTTVRVKCWAKNNSEMTSINAFYLIETRPWAGEYAPANTFLNADTSGSLDPHVPECPGQ